VAAGEGERRPGEQALEDGQGLLQPIHPDPGRVEGHAGPPVLLAQPAGTDAQLEAASGQHVQGGGLLGQEHRVPVVVVQDQAADPQRLGRARGRRQRHQGSQLVAERLGHEMIAQQQGVVAERLGPAGGGHQPRPGADLLPDHPEPEPPPAVRHVGSHPPPGPAGCRAVASPLQHRFGRAGCGARTGPQGRVPAMARMPS
jgi:hypothetical protein